MWRVRMLRETKSVARHYDAPLYETLVRALRQIIGAPDYTAYLEHCRRAGHPVQLTEEQYVKDFFEQRGKRIRCC